MTQEICYLGTSKIVSLVQMSVFLVASVSLLSIWNIGDPAERGRTSKDASILFLACACFVWSVMGFLRYLQAEPLGTLTVPALFRILFSIVNTAFFVGATAGLEAYEKSVPKLLKKMLPSLDFQPAVWVVMGICVALGFLSSMIIMIFAPWYASLPDIVLGVGTLLFMLIGLKRSFRKRGFPALEWLSIFVVCLYIIVQFMELPLLARVFKNERGYDDFHWVANLSIKTMLCLLFMALIVSWMHDKAQTPDPHEQP